MLLLLCDATNLITLRQHLIFKYYVCDAVCEVHALAWLLIPACSLAPVQMLTTCDN